MGKNGVGTPEIFGINIAVGNLSVLDQEFL